MTIRLNPKKTTAMDFGEDMIFEESEEFDDFNFDD